jgi:hypothetical protein
LDYCLFFCGDGVPFAAQDQFCNLKSGSLVSIQEWVAISYDMQSESRFAEKIGLSIDLIDQVVDCALAENPIYSAEIADDQLMDV